MLKIDIKIHFSKIFLIILSLIMTMILFSILLSPVDPLLQVLIFLSAIIGCLQIAKKYLFLLAPSSIHSIQVNTEQEWLITTPAGTEIAQISGETTISSWVLLIRFLTENGPKSCIVFKDAVNKTQFRQLIVRLRTNTAYNAKLKKITTTRSHPHDATHS